jgi:hypothetical protein
MMKRLALATALSALFAGGALAKTPADFEECMQLSSDVTELTDEKLPDDKVSEAVSEKVADLLNKLDEHCEANRFDAAVTVAGQLRAMIDKQ